jgi:hypothetical protein
MNIIEKYLLDINVNNYVLIISLIVHFIIIIYYIIYKKQDKRYPLTKERIIQISIHAINNNIAIILLTYNYFMNPTKSITNVELVLIYIFTISALFLTKGMYGTNKIKNIYIAFATYISILITFAYFNNNDMNKYRYMIIVSLCLWAFVRLSFYYLHDKKINIMYEQSIREYNIVFDKATLLGGILVANAISPAVLYIVFMIGLITSFI